MIIGARLLREIANLAETEEGQTPEHAAAVDTEPTTEATTKELDLLRSLGGRHSRYPTRALHVVRGLDMMMKSSSRDEATQTETLVVRIMCAIMRGRMMHQDDLIGA